MNWKSPFVFQYFWYTYFYYENMLNFVNVSLAAAEMIIYSFFIISLMCSFTLIFLNIKPTLVHYHKMIELSKQTHINHRSSLIPNVRNYSKFSNNMEIPPSFWRCQNPSEAVFKCSFLPHWDVKIWTLNHVSTKLQLDKGDF